MTRRAVQTVYGRGPGARPERAVLRDGRAVRVRAVEPGDEARLRGMFSRLSPRTIYLRFHAPYPRVPEWAVERFVNAHSPREGALLAVAGEEAIGHAMYVPVEGGSEAEVGIVVEDGWQSRGVGKLLLSRLAEAAGCRGVEVFTGEVLWENRRALDLFEAAFAGIRYATEDGVYRVRAPLRTSKTAEQPPRVA